MLKQDFRKDQYKLTTYDPEKKKDVYCGDVIKGVFYRHVEPKHFMRIVNGYGIQEIVFDELEKAGINKVLIVKLDTGESLSSSVQDWLEHGKVADYGHGKQRFLSLTYMKGPDRKSIQ